MSNQHLIMQEKMYSEIEYHLSRVYDEETRTFIYNGERITKFNFEEFASDTEVIDALFELIKAKVWYRYNKHFIDEELEHYNEFANEYLYNLLNEDGQELRASEQP